MFVFFVKLLADGEFCPLPPDGDCTDNRRGRQIRSFHSARKNMIVVIYIVS